MQIEAGRAKTAAMARIIITIPGPWGNDPGIETPFDLRVVDADAETLADIVAVGRKCEALTDDAVGRLRKAKALIEAELAFERPGDRGAAQSAARLAADAFARGAEAVFVESSLRVFSAETLQGAELTDAHTLFHLFVEILMDDEAQEVATEGMQCFDLPDIVAPYTPADPEDPDSVPAASAQAVVFSLAAQMVCDRFRPTSGGVFRASESAPWFRVKLEMPEAEAARDDPFVNPRGRFRLTLRQA